MSTIVDISEFVNLEPVVKPGPNGSVRIYHDKPLVDTLGALLAASYRNGETDAAGADASMMTYEEWLSQVPTHEYVEL